MLNILPAYQIRADLTPRREPVFPRPEQRPDAYRGIWTGRPTQREIDMASITGLIERSDV